MIHFIYYKSSLLKAYINMLICSVLSHKSNPPIIEVWETSNGIQKSAYLCRRCYMKIGEKSYA